MVLFSARLSPGFGKESLQQLPAHNLTDITPAEKDILLSVPAKVTGLTLVVLGQVTCPLLARPGSPTTTGVMEWDCGPKKEKKVMLLLEDAQLEVGKKLRRHEDKKRI